MDAYAISEFFRQFWGLWLMILFIGIVVWAFRPKNKDRFRKDAMIPFKDEEHHEERKNGGHS